MLTHNPDLDIPEQFRRRPGDPARHRGPTRSIMAPRVDDSPKPCKRLQGRSLAEREAIAADLAEKTELAKHGKADR